MSRCELMEIKLSSVLSNCGYLDLEGTAGLLHSLKSPVQMFSLDYICSA